MGNCWCSLANNADISQTPSQPTAFGGVANPTYDGQILPTSRTFLHTRHENHDRILFHDLKSSSILLDESYNAKVSEFGLKELGPAESQSSNVNTRVLGTWGYEYIMTGHVYTSSDVYAFGVVLVEILTGKHVLDLNSDEHNLLEEFQPCLKRESLERIMDHKLPSYPLEAAFIVAQLASVRPPLLLREGASREHVGLVIVS